jgi:hypothetical protein
MCFRDVPSWFFQVWGLLFAAYHQERAFARPKVIHNFLIPHSTKRIRFSTFPTWLVRIFLFVDCGLALKDIWLYWFIGLKTRIAMTVKFFFL